MRFAGKSYTSHGVSFVGHCMLLLLASPWTCSLPIMLSRQPVVTSSPYRGKRKATSFATSDFCNGPSPSSTSPQLPPSVIVSSSLWLSYCLSPSPLRTAPIAVSSLAMAESPGRDKHNPHVHPSQPRNEVRENFVKEKSDAPKSVVQVPDSDPVIPETQLGEGGRFEDHNFFTKSQRDGRDRSLSPSDQAVVERFGTAKKAKALQSSPAAVKLLRKPTIEPIDRFVSSGSNGFSFMPVKKSQSKESPKSEDMIKQVAIHASLIFPTLPKPGEQQSDSKIQVPSRCSILIYD